MPKLMIYNSQQDSRANLNKATKLPLSALTNTKTIISSNPLNPSKTNNIKMTLKCKLPPVTPYKQLKLKKQSTMYHRKRTLSHFTGT